MRNRHRHQGRGENECDNTAGDGGGNIPLSDAQTDKRLLVVSNSDVKTLEMGLYPGALVTLTHNDTGERNIIVKVNDNRYVVPKTTAVKILVRH
ncbi:MAG: ferrous iron transport protein A [Victivallales bacterium]|nr:ferrous iron transport protein A [Victivallales bacterium]